ncbi:MAG: hypothetical protein U0797_11645 [Gemmataceae bacterium]
MVTKAQLVRESLHLEQEVLKETVGSQDQVMAAYGGLRHVKFHPTGEIASDPLVLPAPRRRRVAVAPDAVLHRHCPHLLRRRQELRHRPRGRPPAAADHEGAGGREHRHPRQRHGHRRFGELLHEAWQAKRSLSPQVSNGEVDDLYDRARQAGALGGKLTGAGGGGFLLLFVEPGRQDAVRQALRGRLEVPFRFESSGSQVIFYEPETNYEDADRARRAAPRSRSRNSRSRRRREPRSRIWVAGADTLIGRALVERLRAEGFRRSATSRTSPSAPRWTTSSPRRGPSTSSSRPASPAASASTGRGRPS